MSAFDRIDFGDGAIVLTPHDRIAPMLAELRAVRLAEHIAPWWREEWRVGTYGDQPLLRVGPVLLVPSVAYTSGYRDVGFVDPLGRMSFFMPAMAGKNVFVKQDSALDALREAATLTK